MASKTGGGKGTNQYQVKGASKGGAHATAGDIPPLEELAAAQGASDHDPFADASADLLMDVPGLKDAVMASSEKKPGDAAPVDSFDDQEVLEAIASLDQTLQDTAALNDDDDLDACSTCGQSTAGGECYDGKCGSCSDAAENDNHVSDGSIAALDAAVADAAASTKAARRNQRRFAREKLSAARQPLHGEPGLDHADQAARLEKAHSDAQVAATQLMDLIASSPVEGDPGDWKVDWVEEAAFGDATARGHRLAARRYLEAARLNLGGRSGLDEQGKANLVARASRRTNLAVWHLGMARQFHEQSATEGTP